MNVKVTWTDRCTSKLINFLNKIKNPKEITFILVDRSKFINIPLILALLLQNSTASYCLELSGLGSVRENSVYLLDQTQSDVTRPARETVRETVKRKPPASLRLPVPNESTELLSEDAMQGGRVR